MTPSIKLFFCVLSVLSVSGCKRFNTPERAEELITMGWAGPGPVQHPQSVYCYETLGAPECYKNPRPDMERQLIGFFDRKPKPAVIAPAIMPVNPSSVPASTPVRQGPPPLKIFQDCSKNCTNGCFGS
jgi:hypothetical protein